MRLNFSSISTTDAYPSTQNVTDFLAASCRQECSMSGPLTTALCACSIGLIYQP